MIPVAIPTGSYGSLVISHDFLSVSLYILLYEFLGMLG